MKESTPAGTAPPAQPGELDGPDARSDAAGADAPTRAATAARVLSTLIMAGERYRVEVAGSVRLGVSESQALGYLLLHGSRGQTELADDLGLSSSGAVTALVDRLEQRGLAERTRHPTDRRRLVVRLTTRGEVVAVRSQAQLLQTLDVIPADELPLLTSQLARLADRLQEQSRP